MSETVLGHAIAVYEELERRAKDEVLDGLPVKVFRGKIVDLYNAVGASRQYYSRIFDGLARSGSITFQTKGAFNVESVVILHHPPDREELFAKDLTRRSEFAILTTRLNELSELVGGIDIGEAIYDLTTRIEKLEREVESFGKVT